MGLGKAVFPLPPSPDMHQGKGEARGKDTSGPAFSWTPRFGEDNVVFKGSVRGPLELWPNLWTSKTPSLESSLPRSWWYPEVLKQQSILSTEALHPTPTLGFSLVRDEGPAHSRGSKPWSCRTS